MKSEDFKTADQLTDKDLEDLKDVVGSRASRIWINIFGVEAAPKSAMPDLLAVVQGVPVRFGRLEPRQFAGFYFHRDLDHAMSEVSDAVEAVLELAGAK